MNWETIRNQVMAWDWNWDAISMMVLTFGPGLVLLPLLLIRRAQKLRASSKVAEPPKKDPGIMFLEGALDEDAPRKPNPNYTYAQFKDDLNNKGLTFEEIYEKCGGIFPKKPREPETLAPPPEGGEKKDEDDRHKRLQVWFKERAESGNFLKKLVKPPPNVYPLIQWRNRRR